MLLAGFVAVAAALAADAAGLLSGPEQNTIGLRFELRGEQPVDDVAVVAIDDVTFSDLRRQWPFPRSLHARAIDRLRAAGARVIAYDVQFTEETQAARGPGALRRGQPRAGDRARHHGDRRAGRHADPRRRREPPRGRRAGRRRQRERRAGRRRASASASARAACAASASSQARQAGGPRLDRRELPARRRLDRLPRTARHDPDRLLLRRSCAGAPTLSLLRDRVVVVGATAPTLQDVHPTPASSKEVMSGAGGAGERDLDRAARTAAAQRTRLGGLARDPRRRAGARAGRACAGVPCARLWWRSGLAAGWLVGAQAAFEHGLILPVSAPLIGAAARHAERDHDRLRGGARPSAAARRSTARGSRRRSRAAPSSCARPSSRSCRAWAARSSRATSRPACTSPA